MKDKYRAAFLSRMGLVLKKNNSKLYNVQAVAEMLDLNVVENYKEQCRIITRRLEEMSRDNTIVKNLLDSAKENENICQILVNTLYQLLNPESFPKKAPIKISEKKYKELIRQNKEGIITPDDKAILMEALNCKYCHCIKSIYLKDQFNEYILNQKTSYNRYALCMSSVYKNRNIEPPFRASYTCRDKYSWYI